MRTSFAEGMTILIAGFLCTVLDSIFVSAQIMRATSVKSPLCTQYTRLTRTMCFEPAKNTATCINNA